MTISNQYSFMKKELNEIQWRHYLGMEALRIGFGGINQVMVKSGADWRTIKKGVKEVSVENLYHPGERIRQTGGGRKKLVATDVTLTEDLDALLEPKGDPMTLVKWTTKSLSRLVKALKDKGHTIQQTALYNLLKSLGFSLKANKKNIEGVSHPDRNKQFLHIKKTCDTFEKKQNPIISVDCKKKELIGNFKNNGKEWQPKGKKETVNVYDFKSLSDGKAVPYGVYDILKNTGFVNVGTDHDTASFAVESIRRWWRGVGEKLYPNTKELLITSDGGGSNGVKNRLWKKELQQFANETGLEVTVTHLPPATSKWNKIEHRLFSFISINWRGKPLKSLETIIELLSHTTTKEGLTVAAIVDNSTYPIGLKVSDGEMKKLNIIRNDFHGDWNYVVKPWV